MQFWPVICKIPPFSSHPAYSSHFAVNLLSYQRNCYNFNQILVVHMHVHDRCQTSWPLCAFCVCTLCGRVPVWAMICKHATDTLSTAAPLCCSPFAFPSEEQPPARRPMIAVICHGLCVRFVWEMHFWPVICKIQGLSRHSTLGSHFAAHLLSHQEALLESRAER